MRGCAVGLKPSGQRTLQQMRKPTRARLGRHLHLGSEQWEAPGGLKSRYGGGKGCLCPYLYFAVMAPAHHGDWLEEGGGGLESPTVVHSQMIAAGQGRGRGGYAMVIVDGLEGRREDKANRIWRLVGYTKRELGLSACPRLLASWPGWTLHHSQMQGCKKEPRL